MTWACPILIHQSRFHEHAGGTRAAEALDPWELEPPKRYHRPFP